VQAAPLASGAAQVMNSYLTMMERFLTVQQEVMQAYLTGARGQPYAAPTYAWHPEAAAPVATLPERLASAPTPLPVMAPPPAPVAAPPIVVPQQAMVPPASPVVVPQAQVAPTAPAPQIVASPPPIAETPRTLDAAAISAILVRLVSDRTGYPPEMLEPHLDLEADLGIDSIKRVEIIGGLQQETGLAFGGDVDQLSARKSLREMVEFIVARQGTLSETVTVEKSHRPFEWSLLTSVPGEEATVVCEIRLEEHLFLRDHTLGRNVSRFDPALTGLPVMPFTMSMELLAEAATFVIPNKVVVGMKEIRGTRWIVVENEPVCLRAVAQHQHSPGGDEVFVQIFDAAWQAQNTTPIVSGTVCFADRYPEPPEAAPLALTHERPSAWEPKALYTEGIFHGPAFRGIASMDRWGEDGAKATLETLPTKGLFASNDGSTLITDPVLLDQPGQMVAFWIWERLNQTHHIFPYRLEAIHFYGPPLPAHERVACQGHVSHLDDFLMKSDLDIARADGRVWARFISWEDRRFTLPAEFARFMLGPRGVQLSQPWPAMTASLGASAGLSVRRLGVDDFPEHFFSGHGGIWLKVLAYSVLSRRERDLWHSLRTPEPRRVEWLLARVAAKEALCQLLREQYGLDLLPADVELLPDANGRPTVQGAWLAQVPQVPVVSLAHSGGAAVAIVGDGRAGMDGVGIDIEQATRRHQEIEAVAFSADERSLLATLDADEGWPLRLWCAKEAAAKALGLGMMGGPQSLVIQAVDVGSGAARVGVAGELAAHFHDNPTLTALSLREGKFVGAVVVHSAVNQAIQER
jgi:phosphopantetheinyl transferase/acyl carrier protein